LKNVFFSGISSIQCKIRRDRPTESRRSTCWSPLLYMNFQIINVYVISFIHVCLSMLG